MTNQLADVFGWDRRKIDDESAVAFSYPCLRDYGPARFLPILCPYSDSAHGHLVRESEHGYTVVWFRVFSLGGFEKLLEVLVRKEVISWEERKAALALGLPKTLPKKMSRIENATLANEAGVVASAQAGWWSL